MIINSRNYKTYIAYFISFSFLIFLGSWQIQRLNLKLNVIDKLTERLKIQPCEIHNLKDINIEDFEYRSIKIKGHFINDKEIHLYGGSRVYKGPAGYFIFTPFETLEKQYILVNRGWVPENKKNISTRLDTSINQQIEIEGALLRGEREGIFTLKNNTEKNIWLWIDLANIRKKTELDIPNFFLLEKQDSDSKKLPIGKNLTLEIRNNHLQYAITWYLLAIILTIIFYFYTKQNNNGKS